MKTSKNVVDNNESIDKLIDTLLNNEYVSHANVQRCFNIGYSTAGRIIDEMFRRGYLVSQSQELPISAKYDMAKKTEIRNYLLTEIKRLKSNG